MKIGVAGAADALPPGLASMRWPIAPDIAALLRAHPDLEAVLERPGDRWQARLLVRPDWLPLDVDFRHPRFSEKSLRSGGRATPLARALGSRAAQPGEPAPFAIDATAGLGADAYQIAWLGFDVLGLERNPVAYALLADGLARAPQDGPAQRIRAEFGDAAARLQALAEGPEAGRPDVVYLDPMFAEDDGKTALPKKPMQMFRELIGHDPAGDDALFAAALACARKRVVVKRGPRAPALPGPAPSGACASKAVRFDFYLR